MISDARSHSLTSMLVLGLLACSSAPVAPTPRAVPSAQPAPSPPSPEQPVEALRCIEGTEIPDILPGHEIVNGVAAFTAAPLRLGSPRPALRFAKTGLLIRTGETFEIVAAGDFRFMWGNRRDPVKRLRAPGCDGSKPWMGFPGGFYVSEAGCIEVIVRQGDSEATIKIGVGALCPGQEPPDYSLSPE
jgi:hypothetical protein